MPNLLIIEDDDDMVSSLASLLELYEINVVGHAENGKVGFEMYRQLKPDAILLDLIMPEFDGLYALEKIREHDPNMPVFVVTGGTKPEDIAKLDNLKPTQVFYKPFEIEKISEAIDETLKSAMKVKAS